MTRRAWSACRTEIAITAKARPFAAPGTRG